MNNPGNNRRGFIKNAGTALGGITLFSGLPRFAHAGERLEAGKFLQWTAAPRLRFAVIGINHGHIHSQIDLVQKGGGELVAFFAKEADLADAFSKRYPGVKLARSQAEILEDKNIQLVVSAAIPNERAEIGIAAMQHDKHFLTDKPGITSLKQLASVRRVQKATKKIFAVFFGRLESRNAFKAEELVRNGAIGKVIQTMSLAPHRINAPTRPSWFFDTRNYGGIINDIGSHQFDEFLTYTGSTTANIVAAQTGNFNHPQYPAFEDFGDAMYNGNGGTGYLRVDWFTPDGLKSWGDTRITILGTEGFIEIRKNIDIAGREGGDHIFLTDNKETRYINCSSVTLPYATRFVDDILNRTETFMRQEHCLLACELALKAQSQAKRIKSIGKMSLD
ncbi:MAG: Gfo/Idh/MocA family oxidoreductase [Chitinophagaceae bacterium]|nr:MAG: Gfo/Idh/MocA family oxidoreductase [Chitinophagaceae bacterium]